MIKFLETSDVLQLRSDILRDGKLAPASCVVENDDAKTTFHLGSLFKEKIVSVATFHLESHPDFAGAGFRLRGMATSFDYQGQGFGNKLLNFAIVYLRGQKANYIWCNAREKAFKFYLSLGFEFVSDSFEIPGIGLHRVMYLKIQ